MGKHRLAAHVADGEDVRIGRLLPVVDADKSFGVHDDAGVLEPDAVGVRPSPHRHEHAGELSRERPLRPLKLNPYSRAGVGELHHLGSQVDRREEFFQPLLKRLDEIAISPGEERVGQLNHRHL